MARRTSLLYKQETIPDFRKARMSGLYLLFGDIVGELWKVPIGTGCYREMPPAEVLPMQVAALHSARRASFARPLIVAVMNDYVRGAQGGGIAKSFH